MTRPKTNYGVRHRRSARVLAPLRDRRSRTELVMLTRRQFAIGSAAMASSSVINERVGKASSARFEIPLPIPELVDAAKQGNAVRIKIMSARHAFLHGKPAKTYGYSAPILGPVIRVRNADEVEMTVEN